ncbi:2Fe-2S iron-sulfur cluster-binding protein [Paraburkholderia sp. BR13439]
MIDWSEEQGSVLELAEANGIAAPSSCRAGTCVRRVLRAGILRIAA